MRVHGVSLVEVLIAVVIVAILTTLATPSFIGIIQVARLQAEVNSLVNDLQYARSEAVKRGMPVSLCPSTNGATCVTANQNVWQGGWIVFNDVNGSGAVDSANDSVLRVHAALTNGDTFVAAPATTKAFTYSRDGFAMNLSNGTVTVALHTSPLNSNATRCVEVNIVGRQTVLKPGTRACS